MNKKTKLIVFASSIILSAIILCFFLTGYYSVDTERIYFQGYTDYATKDAYIRDGRFISAIIFIIVGIFNPEIKTMHIINVIISIFILSICVVEIYNLITKYGKTKEKKQKIIAFIISYTYIFNFIIVDILQFVDSFVISASILCFIMAIKKIIIEKHKKVGFALTLLGVLCYQGTIPMYIATAILVTLLENKKINIEYFKKILPCAISIIVSALVSVALVNLVPVVTGMELTDRISKIEYLENIEKNILKMGEVILYSFDLFPPYLWISITILILALSAIVGIRKKNIQFPINVLFIFMMYIFSWLIMFPIQIVVNAPRVSYVVGQAVSAMLIYIYCTNFGELKSKFYINSIVIITIIYFIITIFSILKSTYDLKLANKLDQNFSQKIYSEITKLEEQGITINKITIRYTDSGKNIKKYSQLLRNNSAYLLGTYNLQRFEFYTGKRIEGRVPNFTEEIEHKYFDGKKSEDEVQFHNEGNILYILVDL